MSVKYSGVLKFTDEIKAKIDLAADGAVEKAVVIDGDGVETPIGGATSDYTTATVSITNNLASSVNFALASLVSFQGSDFMAPVISVGPSATKTVTAVLYKGSATCQMITPFEQDVEVTTTGSISNIEDDITLFNITGNGAITLAAKE